MRWWVKRFLRREGRVSPERAERCLKFIPVWKHRAPIRTIDFGRVKDMVGRYGERGIWMASDLHK